MRHDQRSPEAQSWRRLYNTTRWRKIRADQLRREPLCAMCLTAGRTTPATVCDHIDPATKQNPETFYLGPFQSLCKPCHDANKQKLEKIGYTTDVNPTTGIPIDPNHPFNK